MGHTRTLVIVAAVAVAAVAAGCGGGGVGETADDEPGAAAPARVVLLRADDPGPHPFGPSFGESLAAFIDRDVRDAIDRSLSAERVDGSVGELYGRVDLQPPCDLEGLVELYAGSVELTEVVAEVLDVSTSSLSSFLRSYVAVVLTRDTFVIDHHLVDGAAVAAPAVLEAGTTVLIDPRGQPRLRCASASPMTQPDADDIAAADDAQPVGEAWPGFDPGAVVVVDPAPDPLRSLDLAELGVRG